ncbi:MAG: copper chaperone PCu(A)C [Candidatus Competibacter sp.]|nr:copper chaperone PCu(A)C [Candidatus Competibacter sp.]MDG4583050.1 copper chaperone PCu(A)C [Candidatus Competibacter sp.]
MRAIPFGILLAFGAAAFAADGNPLRIEQPWAAETPPAARVGAAYLSIVNGGEADRLLGAKAEVARHVELHRTAMEGHMMRMRQVEALEIPGGTTTVLEPGGIHIMLIDLKQPLRAGQNVPLTLEFEKAGALQVQVPIRRREEMQPSTTPPMHEHNHGDGQKMKRE